MADTKRCKHCKTSIHKLAILCVHCNKYQNAPKERTGRANSERTDSFPNGLKYLFTVLNNEEHR